MPTPSIIANRLREIRRAQGFTLKQVEIRSRGEWKSVVIGSYERGTRTLSVDKAIRLCEFYGVPLSALFADNQPAHVDSTFPALDLLALRRFPTTKDLLAISIQRVTSTIIKQRSDWNGQIITIRSSDWQMLACFLGTSTTELARGIEHRGLDFQLKN